MRGVYLPGGRRVDVRDIADPRPAFGQVVVRIEASTICGSDVRAIYRQHTGSGAEAYRDVVAGHEPAGVVTEVGRGGRRIRVGDRVAIYHIAGCGQCAECRRGYVISCTAPERAAYGWQRDGGHADYLLAEEASCVRLPDRLSFLDGACVACGFGTAYEALIRLGVSGADSLLVTGLGPVGLAAGLLARRLGATPVYGMDPQPERAQLAVDIGAVDDIVEAPTVSAAVDCSGSAAGRRSALRALARWGRLALVGEGGSLEFDVSAEVIHRQLTIIGSWVTSIGRMAELVDRMAAWDLHAEPTVTHRFGLADAAAAYELADSGAAGKIALEPRRG
jgi:threonine dehydrogenase-like Zn-dependent dehydrogenase